MSDDILSATVVCEKCGNMQSVEFEHLELTELREDRERLDEALDGRHGLVIIDRTSPDTDDWVLLHTRQEIDDTLQEARDGE